MKLIKTETNEAVVERARRVIASNRKIRWILLIWGFASLGVCLFAWFKVLNLDSIPHEQLTEGFVAGFVLAITSVTFGVIGGLCIAKSFRLSTDFRAHELLVKYYDRLRNALGPDFNE